MAALISHYLCGRPGSNQSNIMARIKLKTECQILLASEDSMLGRTNNETKLSSISSYSSPPSLGAVKMFWATMLRLPHHIPLITAPSLRWTLAMGLSYSKTVIYFPSLWQI
jgi:hypothetical protein